MVFIYIYGHVRKYMFLYVTENLALKTTCQNSFPKYRGGGGQKKIWKQIWNLNRWILVLIWAEYGVERNYLFDSGSSPIFVSATKYFFWLKWLFCDPRPHICHAITWGWQWWLSEIAFEVVVDLRNYETTLTMIMMVFLLTPFFFRKVHCCFSFSSVFYAGVVRKNIF